MNELNIVPIINEKTNKCSLVVSAPTNMESKKEYFNKRKLLINELIDNNMNYSIHNNHSKSMKIIFEGNETLITFKMMFT